MAINLTKIIEQIQTRLDDSTQSERSIDQLIRIANRIDNSGTQILSYKSIGQLPSTDDSAYVGTIAYVETDNVFGDSGGRFVFASGRDSGWLKFTTIQDSDEATIQAPGGASLVYDDYATWPGGVLQGQNAGFRIDGIYDDKYSYASDGNATNNYPANQPSHGAGISGATHGYTVDAGPNTVYVSRYQYSTETFDNPWIYFNGPANLPNSQRNPGNNGGGGQSSVHGYYHGVGPSAVGISVQDSLKFPFAEDTSWSVVADQHDLDYSSALRTVSSPAATYSAGGYDVANSPPHKYWSILKMPFANDTTMAVSGSLAIDYDRQKGNGSMSITRGYYAGAADTGNGANSPNQIWRIDFASDGDGTDVGDLTVGRGYASGTSSTTHGYTHGGSNTANLNTIDKYPFSSEGNATDVGDLNSADAVEGGFMY